MKLTGLKKGKMGRRNSVRSREAHVVTDPSKQTAQVDGRGYFTSFR
jgi:hypothetical protein